MEMVATSVDHALLQGIQCGGGGGVNSYRFSFTLYSLTELQVVAIHDAWFFFSILQSGDDNSSND